MAIRLRKRTPASRLVIADMDRAFGPAAGLEMVERLVELRHSGAKGTDRVVGVGMDSTELGIDPVTYLPAYDVARAAGLRLTAHQGENSGAAEIAACVDVLGVDRIDHGLPILDDPELTKRVAERRIPLTVCPTSNVCIANKFDRLEDHVYPQLRAAGLLATLNTDDPALSNLDLGSEYLAVATAFDWGWDEMVAIALDGVEACWLDESGKSALRRVISEAASTLAPGA